MGSPRGAPGCPGVRSGRAEAVLSGEEQGAALTAAFHSAPAAPTGLTGSCTGWRAGGRQWCIVVTRRWDPQAPAASAGRPTELSMRPHEPLGPRVM